VTGRIFDIQRFSIHDGPGIRTTVFLKGCFLRCLWCHNPEGIGPEPLLSYIPRKCVGCADCVAACPEAALQMRERDGAPPVAVLSRRRCTGCGECPKVCDAQALQMVGRDVTGEEVLAIVLRDREYYEASGGGLTLSGGEPMFQPGFTEALLRAARRERLHTAVETAGSAPWERYERILPLVDLFFYDCKESDDELHRTFTGFPRAPVVENLRRLHAAGASIVLRCPMIPEFNARREHLDGIASLARSLPNLKGVEILPYHRLGRAKLERFGLETRMPESVKPPDARTLEGWIRHLAARGVRQISQSPVSEAACKDFPGLCASL
jgi:pyruvate formate lyase activating enzyme